MFYVFKLFVSISRLFHVQIMLSLSSTLHSLKNLVIACCFLDSSAYVAEFLRYKFCKSIQFANIVKILPRENFPLYGRCSLLEVLTIQGAFNGIA